MVTGKWVKGRGPGFDQLYELRVEVFCREQGIPQQLELDEFDEISAHAAVFDEEGLCATGRVYPDKEGFRIGRICVKKEKRGLGYGAMALDMLIYKAQSAAKSAKVYLHAQKTAEGFYLRRGFVPEGEPFLEDGVLHVKMRQNAPKKTCCQ